MAYFPDLSSYTHSSRNRSKAVTVFWRVGWLQKERSFPVGETSTEFKAKLNHLCQQAGRRRRGSEDFYVTSCGIHRCDFCDDPSAVSSKEIRLRGSARTYEAPELIHHYVTAHSYLPPSEFIDAVLKWDGEVYEEP
jgi:hypothetical protein